MLCHQLPQKNQGPHLHQHQPLQMKNVDGIVPCELLRRLLRQLPLLPLQRQLPRQRHLRCSEETPHSDSSQHVGGRCRCRMPGFAGRQQRTRPLDPEPHRSWHQRKWTMERNSCARQAHLLVLRDSLLVNNVAWQRAAKPSEAPVVEPGSPALATQAAELTPAISSAAAATLGAGRPLPLARRHLRREASAGSLAEWKRRRAAA